MIWKKSIYDSLTGCTAVCSEFATECSNSDDIENWCRSIILSLDCADMCSNLAMLYVRDSKENARLLAETCMKVCEKCAQEVSQFNSERARQVYAVCKKTIYSCVIIIEMGYQTGVEASNPTAPLASLFYDVNLRETFYN